METDFEGSSNAVANFWEPSPQPGSQGRKLGRGPQQTGPGNLFRGRDWKVVAEDLDRSSAQLGVDGNGATHLNNGVEHHACRGTSVSRLQESGERRLECNVLVAELRAKRVVSTE
jgi:hypothetical protein